ncbi:MAG: NTP transferase domain-containing protein [Candidatus Omnitrophica bacterium]|nr:NTP transferase domain-containing protein [Candidatus Omnitrophota bacterium]
MAQDQCLIGATMTVRGAMQRMSDLGRKELFIIDESGCLTGALSDGDIRRWILKGEGLDVSVVALSNTSPRAVSKGYSPEAVKELMLANRIESVPVLDQDGKVLDILLWNVLFGQDIRHWRLLAGIPAVIMAGGRGTRLDPFTKILPKPLVPVGDRAVLQVIMDRLHEHGIADFHLVLNYKAGLIRSYVEDLALPYHVSFIHEKEALGTAGGLKLLSEGFPDTFILSNCDVMIDAEYADILEYHRTHGCLLTAVVCCRHFQIPYGVCELNRDGLLKQIHEKPGHDYLVNTGVYIMDRRVIDMIPPKEVGMDVLIAALIAKGHRVGAYPVSEKQWVDIGQWDEYHKALRSLGV